MTAAAENGSGSNGEPEPYGAAPERTAMAWRRTGLSVIVGCFLVFHTAVQLGALVVGIAAACLGALIAGVSVFAFPGHRYRRSAAPVASWSLLVAVVSATMGLATLGTAAAVIALTT